MIYDVTLHPFDERTYVQLFLPVLLDERPEDELVAAFGTDAEARRLLQAWMPRMREALKSLRSGDGVPWSAVVNMAFAAMSAHLHPAYHLGDLGLSYWHNPGEALFRPHARSMAILASRCSGLGVSVSEIREGFCGPYTAGSYIPAGDVPHVLREIERSARVLSERLELARYEPRPVLHALLEVLHYARERQLAVLEATHAVAPDRKQALFPINHLRASWSRTLHPAVGARLDELLR